MCATSLIDQGVIVQVENVHFGSALALFDLFSVLPSVLELGAGAAVPSLVAALNGARIVVATDYPDRDLVANMEANAARNVRTNNIHVRGYVCPSAVRTCCVLCTKRLCELCTPEITQCC